MHRFFINTEDIDEGFTQIGGADFEHMTRVLRLRVGDEIAVCDGAGKEYHAKVHVLGKQRAIVELLSCTDLRSEPSTQITLYQGMPKAGKLETIAQKCTEIGVSAISPFFAARSVPTQKLKRDERVERIIYEAAKQSGRGRVPKLSTPMSFGAMLECASEHELLVVAYEFERTRSIADALRAHRSCSDIGIVVGPEGGFEPDEIDMLQRIGKHVEIVTLGRRILRTETAGPIITAIILYEWGEMS